MKQSSIRFWANTVFHVGLVSGIVISLGFMNALNPSPPPISRLATPFNLLVITYSFFVRRRHIQGQAKYIPSGVVPGFFAICSLVLVGARQLANLINPGDWELAFFYILSALVFILMATVVFLANRHSANNSPQATSNQT